MFCWFTCSISLNMSTLRNMVSQNSGIPLGFSSLASSVFSSIAAFFFRSSWKWKVCLRLLLFCLISIWVDRWYSLLMLLHPHGRSAIHTPHQWVPLLQRQCFFSGNTKSSLVKEYHITHPDKCDECLHWAQESFCALEPYWNLQCSEKIFAPSCFSFLYICHT